SQRYGNMHVKGHDIPHPPGSHRFPTHILARRFSIHSGIPGVSNYHLVFGNSVTGRLAAGFSSHLQNQFIW
ncbi:MAG: hypothetical protein KAU31_09975, partial [Spirochaetaceae bacterium]|nr:hypothetical protein [Spirochaetaceae bacterium]